jgi:phosphatidylglycerol:prolipoprotein diacylglycerol transferase
MRPILFNCGPLRVPSYAAALYLGIVIGLYANIYASSLGGVHPGRVTVAAILLLFPALIGARLLFVATHWQQFQDRRRIFHAADGGAAMYGGIFLAVPFSVPLLSAFGVSFGSFWDVASFSILIGMFFARLGCLLRGCCAGRQTFGWFGMYLPDSHGVWARRIPAQLLEAAAALLILGLAVLLWRKHPSPGSIFLLVITAYGAARVLLECTRQEQISVRGVRLNRALSGCCVFAGVIGYAAIAIS